MEVRCQCGAELEPATRFCGVCGTSLVALPPPGLLQVPETVRDEKVGSMKMPSSSGGSLLGVVLNDRFRVDKKLGEGGFGAVYLGTQLKTGRAVALKVLHPSRSESATVSERFRREGQVLCSLRDVHTVTTYDFDQTKDGTLFIAMELLEGTSLHEVFHREAPIPWSRMLAIASAICSSLAEAHEKGIVHRDLKPENIYLEHRQGVADFVKVLDFGIAKLLNTDANPQLTATGQTLGTLEYMSPEQLMGKNLTGGSDIYTLGVVMYELISGRLPFPDANGPVALITAQLQSIPPPLHKVTPTEIPKDVSDLVSRMLHKDPLMRFRSAEDLKQEIERILQKHSNDAAASAAKAPGSYIPSGQVASRSKVKNSGVSDRVFWAGVIAAAVLGAVAAFAAFQF